jgi:hypothetical protein
MIEKHYAKHIANTLDAAAINVMRPRVARQPNSCRRMPKMRRVPRQTPVSASGKPRQID